ncbi:MAG: class I SAM-dependent methyltransferase, partial [Patescibacteria group bacterium]|nr:class I SAM-dependent methyltransferase [Patescibacteria group bacterium]
NWDWSARKIRSARDAGREVSVLNLFGYTGAATVVAAAAGASVCHVDAAEGMVKWCRENIALSGLGGASVRYIVDDCLKFVRRELKRGRRYDAIIMDPPTYGRGGGGELWKLEDNLWELLAECRKALSDRPLFFLINAYTARLSPSVVINLLDGLLNEAGGRIHGGEVGLPVQRDGKILPCGIYGRWESA